MRDPAVGNPTSRESVKTGHRATKQSPMNPTMLTLTCCSVTCMLRKVEGETFWPHSRAISRRLGFLAHTGSASSHVEHPT